MFTRLIIRRHRSKHGHASSKEERRGEGGGASEWLKDFWTHFFENLFHSWNARNLLNYLKINKQKWNHKQMYKQTKSNCEKIGKQSKQKVMSTFPYRDFVLSFKFRFKNVNQKPKCGKIFFPSYFPHFSDIFSKTLW